MAEAVRVGGLAEVQAGIREIVAGLQDLQVMQDIAAEAAHLAASFAPRRTGRLAASIRPNKAKSKAQVKAGNARTPYAAAINWGWPKRHIAPAGFMQRADSVMKPRLPGLVDAAVAKLIEQGKLS